MTLLVIEDDNVLREVVGFVLESELGIEVEFASSVADAKSLISRNTGFSVIICDYDLGDGTAEDVFAHLQAQKKKPPFILWSASDPAKHPFFKESGLEAVISKSEPYEKLLETIRRAFPDGKEAKAGPVSEYCRIRTSTILKQGLLTCDLYLKLAEDRFVRVLREGDVFGLDDFDRFKDKGMTFLHLKRVDAQKVIEKLAQDLLQITESSAMETEELYCVSVSTMEAISNLAQALGFTEEVRKITQANVALVVKNIQANGVLSGLLERLVLDPERYLASHSVLLSYLTCGIASLMDWKSETTYYKLTLASFLHDILLTDQELARKQTLPEIYGSIGRFSGREIETYLQHPKLCAELLKGMGDIPSNVDLIILQHHERPDGSGFPSKENHDTISPLAAVLILAHELLLFREESESKALEPADMHRFMTGLSLEYQRGVFRSLFLALEESVAKQL